MPTQARIVEMAEANGFLQESFLPQFNGRFGLKLTGEHRWRRPGPGVDLESGYSATVANDNCVRLFGLLFDLPVGPYAKSWARKKAEMRQMLDGSWRIYIDDKLITTAGSTELREPFKAEKRRKDAAKGAVSCEWVYELWIQTADETPPLRRQRSPSEKPDYNSHRGRYCSAVKGTFPLCPIVLLGLA